MTPQQHRLLITIQLYAAHTLPGRVCPEAGVAALRAYIDTLPTRPRMWLLDLLHPIPADDGPAIYGRACTLLQRHQDRLAGRRSA